MKTYFYILAICTWGIAKAYANQANANYKIQTVKLEQEINQPTFKISERVVLKKQPLPIKEEENKYSTFSMEELRVGAQRILDESEIQYFKSQCRYAFMSDKDVIENHCEAKPVKTKSK